MSNEFPGVSKQTDRVRAATARTITVGGLLAFVLFSVTDSVSWLNRNTGAVTALAGIASALATAVIAGLTFATWQLYNLERAKNSAVHGRFALSIYLLAREVRANAQTLQILSTLDEIPEAQVSQYRSVFEQPLQTATIALGRARELFNTSPSTSARVLVMLDSAADLLAASVLLAASARATGTFTQFLNRARATGESLQASAEALTRTFEAIPESERAWSAEYPDLGVLVKEVAAHTQEPLLRATEAVSEGMRQGTGE